MGRGRGAGRDVRARLFERPHLPLLLGGRLRGRVAGACNVYERIPHERNVCVCVLSPSPLLERAAPSPTTALRLI